MKLTIFTPTYNRKELLKRAYESLRAQTCKDFCWLIVDDGSTDDTASAVEEWGREGIIPIEYLYFENGGKMRAHNRGVENCRTEWFLCLDSDDRLVPDAVEEILRCTDSLDVSKPTGSHEQSSWAEMAGTSVRDFTQACASAKRIALKIECGFIPYNCLHIFALKAASVWMIIAVMCAGLAGKLELSMVLIVSFLSMSIFNSVEPIADSAHVLSVINNAFDKMEMFSDTNLLDAEGTDIIPENHDIEFSNVDFSYSDASSTENRKVLKDVSFTIPEGSTTAIVGPSGSGKTTICNLIARFYDVTGGRITLGGTDVREYSLDSLLKNISMVFQNVYLFNDTIRANICFGRDNVTEEEMIDAAKKARCHDFIMELPNGYDTVIGEGGGTLSGGQKQRISIARAILKDSPVIILDESTASIDPENEHLIQGAITELSRGKTVIIIAHRLATIEAADQILVVDDGRIVEKGRHSELVNLGGRYAGFVKIRQQAENWQIA